MKKKIIIVLVVIIICFIYKSVNSSSSRGYVDQKSKSNSNTQLNNPNVNYVAPKSDNKQIEVKPQRIICPTCRGSESCFVCRGLGYNSMYGYTSACKACDGRGTSVDEDGNRYGNGKCSTCHGAGYIMQ